jgi:hypothetical protein
LVVDDNGNRLKAVKKFKSFKNSEAKRAHGSRNVDGQACDGEVRRSAGRAVKELNIIARVEGDLPSLRK